MKKTILLTVIMGLFLSCNIFAQKFDRTYGSTDADFGESIPEAQEIFPDGWTIPKGNFVEPTDSRNNGTIQYVGGCMWTGMSDVFVTGDNVWCSFLDGLQLIDISNISNPEFLSKVYTPLYTLKEAEIMGENVILIEGDYAYIGDNEGVRIVNINDMELISTYSMRRAHALYLRDNNLYVCDGTGFWVLDISDPAVPDSIGFYEKSGAVGLDIVGNYAYVSSTAGASLIILDISIPENPTFLSELNSCGFTNELIVENGYAYLASCSNGFNIVDVSNPLSPVFKSNIDFEGSVMRIAMIDPQFMVLSLAIPNSIEVIDVSDPYNPFVAASYEGSGNLFVDGDRLFEVGSFSTNIQDVQDPLNFSSLGSIDVEAYSSEKVRVSGNLAYIIDMSSAFHYSMNIVDIIDPYNPFVRGNYPISGWSWIANLDAKDGYAYVINQMAGIVWIIDASNPDLPVLTGEYDPNGIAEDIFVGDPYTCLLVDNDLQIVDLQDPSNTLLISSITVSDTVCKKIYVDNGYAFIGDDIGDVWIVDISDSLTPLVVSTYSASPPQQDAPTGIFALGNSTYIVFEEQLQIADISNINNPEIVGSYSDYNWSRYSRIYVKAGYAFIVNSMCGLIKIDVNDPTAPFREEFFQTEGWCMDLAFENDYLNIVTNTSFLILEDDFIQGIGDENHSILSNCNLSQNRPNPFNLSTTISYQLEEPEEVIFNIYNVQGQLVKNLVDSWQSSGLHSVVWNGTDDSGNPVSNGIYFYKMKYGDKYTGLKKMILILLW